MWFMYPPVTFEPLGMNAAEASARFDSGEGAHTAGDVLGDADGVLNVIDGDAEIGDEVITCCG